MLANQNVNGLSTRTEDYLNDKFQSSADLEDVDNLLAKVHEQQILLKQQLLEAQEQRSKTESTAKDHENALRLRTAKFRDQQRDLDRSLNIITQSEVSDEAVKKFEQRLSTVRRLEIATGYIYILKETDELAQSARKNVKSNPNNAVQSYIRIRTLLNGLEAAQPDAEGAAPHLVDDVQHTTHVLYEELKKEVEESYRQTLDQMAWPKKDLKILGGVLEDWQNRTDLLLRLQEPNIKNTPVDGSGESQVEPVILLPLAVMVHPLDLRFRYHFYGERPTNRLDKPEYFFSHILDILDQHSAFMTNALQPMLDDRIRTSEQLEGIYTDAVSTFITALLPMVKTKCLSLLPQLTSQPQLLSHLIHEMMAFDNSLRDSWAYNPIPGPYTEWKGITWDILNTHEYFNVWLNVEKDFALARYKTIRDAPESNVIDYDGAEKHKTKPTKGAVRVNDLLETITDRYRSLTSFSQKMKFLMDIQLSIFDDYHNHLHGVLQAYLVSSHTAGRLIQGQTEAEAVGFKGLESLAKVFGSAEYLERKMADWSDDVFFLELWEELQDRVRRNTGHNAVIGNELNVEDVAAKTSSSIKSGANIGDDEENGALFDETARSYQRLRQRSEAEIARAMEINVRNSIKPLFKVSIWASISTTTSDPALLAPSSALDGLLQTLSSLMGFLAKVLGGSPLRRINKQVCSVLQKEVYDNVIMRNSFSTAGASQLRRDIVAIAESLNGSIGVPGEAQRHFQRIEDALVLLCLPIKASSSQQIESNDEWGFDSEDDQEHQAQGFSDETNTYGLWQAEKAIFANNESARKALAAMHLEHLNESEARNVIKRRIEVNS